jgi:hypothetical protein
MALNGLSLKVMFRRPAGQERINFNSVLIRRPMIVATPFSRSEYAKQQ